MDIWTHVAFSKLRSAWPCAVECCCGAFQRVKCDSDSLSAVRCAFGSSVQPKRFRLVIATRARGLCQLPPSTVEAWDVGRRAMRRARLTGRPPELTPGGCRLRGQARAGYLIRHRVLWRTCRLRSCS